MLIVLAVLVSLVALPASLAMVGSASK